MDTSPGRRRRLPGILAAFLLASWGGASGEEAPGAPGGSSAPPAQTPVEAEFLELLPRLAPQSRAKRQDLFTSLRAGGTPPASAFMQAIAGEHAQLIGTLKRRLDAGHLKSLRKRAREDLAARRKEALGFILDEKRYPQHGDPYSPEDTKAQEQASALVAAVEASYHPSLEELGKRLCQGRQGLATADVLAALEEAEAYLQAGGTPPGETLRILLEGALPKLDLGKEEESATENARILEENAALATKLQAEGALDAEEAGCILITNRYRIMMGLIPLKIEPKLVQASRGHSQDMATRRYFAHVSPEGKMPWDRARAAGFQGRVSENIYAGGDGDGAFNRWQHSSGHHRAMLLSSGNKIGVGRSGTHWTMLLGL